MDQSPCCELWGKPGDNDRRPGEEMAFARMIMTADDYLHTVCLLFIALGVLVVGGDNES